MRVEVSFVLLGVSKIRVHFLLELPLAPPFPERPDGDEQRGGVGGGEASSASASSTWPAPTVACLPEMGKRALEP